MKTVEWVCLLLFAYVVVATIFSLLGYQFPNRLYLPSTLLGVYAVSLATRGVRWWMSPSRHLGSANHG